MYPRRLVRRVDQPALRQEAYVDTGRYPFLAFRYRLGLAGAVYRHARKWRSYVYVCVRGLSYSGRYRCGAGLHGIADVYRRGGSGRSPGESGGMEPVCHYLWYAGGIFRELYDRPSRRCRLAEYDRLALDVRFRDYSGGIVPLVLDVRAGDASLSRDAWAYGEGVGRLEPFDGSGGRWP